MRLVFLLLTAVVSAESLQFHHGLSENDLIHYFGTNKRHEVPDYDIITPTRVPTPVQSLRHRRDSGVDDFKKYHLTAFGEEYPLSLVKNERLIPSECLVHRMGHNGTTHVVPCRASANQNCYYLGESAFHNGSIAAVSTCRGLHGMVSTEHHDLLITPLKEKHRQHLTEKQLAEHEHPHVVYKRVPKTKTCRVKRSDSVLKSLTTRHKRAAGEKTIELMVVVDTKMWWYHEQDTQRYVLTSLNVAAQRYLHHSLGQDIIFSVVKLVILEQQQNGLDITPDADFTLSKFCNWQAGINPYDDNNPQHADGAILITRENIHQNGEEATTGLAYVGGMCNQRSKCAYVEDTGLDMGLTIAHEAGHNLGMNHDGDGNACANSNNLMSSDGGKGPSSLLWSSCSAQQLRSFLATSQANCLTDSPPSTQLKLIEDKPGLVYDGDAQCKLRHGEGSTLCGLAVTKMLTANYGDECSRLVCTDPTREGYCTAGGAPRMDGTACDQNRKWCIMGKCVDTTGPTVDGGWSAWDAQWSACSRSCGGGVRMKRRYCNNPKPGPGGQNCIGDSFVAEMCNPQVCATSQYSFKAEQCAATNSQPFNGALHTWEPYQRLSGDAQCELSCQAVGAGFIATRGKGQYLDGTECSGDGISSFSRCVDAKCMPFGCDGQLNSGKVYDRCGVCDGAGDTCQVRSGTYTEGREKEYVPFVTIPTGATGIDVTNSNYYSHMNAVVNGKAIFSPDGNGPDNSGTYSRDGVTVSYRKRGPEKISIVGPVTSPVQLQVWRQYGDGYVGVNPEIAYKYYEASNVQVSSDFQWKSKITQCSTSCGTGQQLSEAYCVRMTDGTQVADHYCDFRTKPSVNSRPCNTQPCPAR
ncbi:A disintegrin and metalloproteinase with thrombospondin motifs 18-like [Lingula anatina]|uniref:A disintegrin and metalloproteinase with thrombospondin motifs 18-like n=1 Tax=Lingula anatina TaxID=7574 RepID=A0A1S3JUF4_LINAN|nr:A disintegrin and metalloproteinase with thrombospondin motifs 18-like [Lingula anatina]|eukprot:XP_013413726.1 A disintegrin and metalloproteinase with thrombospondin motifs 18-like [Lingula anatina]